MKKILLFLFILSSTALFSQTRVCYSFADANAESGLNSPTAIDTNIDFESLKNSGTSNPGIFSNQLRLYQNATKGGSIKFYPKNGVAITKIEIIASDRTGNAGYNIDGGTNTDISIANGSYDINNLSVNTGYVEFFQKDASSSNRIYVDQICVTYVDASCSISNLSTSVTCNGNNADVTITYDNNNSSAQEYSIDGGSNYNPISSGNTITVSGPTSSANNFTLMVRDTDTANNSDCTATIDVEIPTCPEPCTISNLSATTVCNGDNAEVTITYDTNNSSAQEYSIDGGANYTAISSGNTITVSGPTSNANNFTLLVRDTDTTNNSDCTATTDVEIPTCPQTATGGEIVFQMINPCGNDGANEFVVVKLNEETNIDDIAIGSRGDSSTPNDPTDDNSWNYFWNTVASSTTGNSLLAGSTASQSYDILDPSITADNTIINDRINTLNSTAVSGSNTDVFVKVPSTGVIPAGSTLVLFLGAGDATGLDRPAEKLPFSDASYDQAGLYAIFGNGTQNGFFSNTAIREQRLYINGTVTNFTYDASGGNEALYVDALGNPSSTTDCIPPLQTLVAEAGALPVSFISFEVDNKDSYRLLSWSTATEINNDRFEIERSTDGFDFEYIGTVEGSGTTTEETKYSFNDYDELSSKVVYYRLKQIDYDNTNKYSKTVYLDLSQDIEVISVYPNPVNSTNRLTIKGEINSFEVFDIIGRKIESIDTDKSIYHLNTTHYQPGQYILKFKDGSTTRFTKI